MPTHTIDGTESATAIIWASALGVDIRWRGCRHGVLFAPDGATIGSYHKTPGGYSIWTTPYAGFAYRHELELLSACTCQRPDEPIPTT